MKVEPLLYGDRKVYTVSAFNHGVASWVARLPTLWVEGEVTEFRRQPGWQSVFFTLKDPSDGACLPVSMPRGRIGRLTGNEAAAKRDFVTAVQSRFPAANVLVAQTYVQGPAAPAAIAAALGSLAREPDVDVIVVTRGGGSFEDLLPFSDERVVRAVAECAVPVVSAVGHEQDTPLCDHAADVRASTPTAAARLVVPDEQELRGRLD